MTKVSYDPTVFRDFITSRYPDEVQIMIDAFESLHEDGVWVCAVPDFCEIKHIDKLGPDNVISIACFFTDEYMPEVG